MMSAAAAPRLAHLPVFLGLQHVVDGVLERRAPLDGAPDRRGDTPGGERTHRGVIPLSLESVCHFAGGGPWG